MQDRAERAAGEVEVADVIVAAQLCALRRNIRSRDHQLVIYATSLVPVTEELVDGQGELLRKPMRLEFACDMVDPTVVGILRGNAHHLERGGSGAESCLKLYPVTVAGTVSLTKAKATAARPEMSGTPDQPTRADSINAATSASSNNTNRLAT